MDGGSWDGEWWLPAHPDARVEGTLALDSAGFSLDTRGVLEQQREPEPNDEGEVAYTTFWEPKQHAVVHGRLPDGRPVTLLEADGLATLPPFNIASERWRPRVALLGVHLKTGDDRLFGRASIKLEHLAAFAGDPHAAVQIEQDGTSGACTRVSFEAERRVLQRAVVLGATVELVSTPLPRLAGARAEVEVVVSLDAELHAPSGWATVWTDFVLPLRDLLGILLGRSVAVLSLTLTAEPGSPPVRVLLRMPEPVEPARRAVSADDFVLRSDGLPGGFDQAMNAWFALRERTLSGVRELVGVLNAPHSYVDDKLLAYVRAVGPLLSMEGKAAAKTDAAVQYQEWLDRVSEVLPDDLREAVIGRLKPLGPNERHRLVALIGSLGPIGEWLAGGNVAEFATRVIATRVGLAHPSSEPPKNALSGAALVAHTLALGWLVRAVLLLGLGMSQDELGAALRGTQAEQAADTLAEVLRALA